MSQSVRGMVSNLATRLKYVRVESVHPKLEGGGGQRPAQGSFFVAVFKRFRGAFSDKKYVVPGLLRKR